MIARLPIIGVMGAHEQEWEALSVPVGKMIAEYGYHLLTGAGAGVMTAVAYGFTSVKDRAGRSIGVVPTTHYDGDLVPRADYPNNFIEVPIITPLSVKAESAAMPFSRNHVNIMTSNAVIVLPGSHGTKDEVALCIKFNKPFILYGPQDAFVGFPEQCTRVDSLDEVREFLDNVNFKIRTDGE